MAQQQGVVKGDTLQKLGSAAFIIGAILLIVFNILLPRSSDPSNTQEMLNKWGDQKGLTQLCALLLAVGIWGVMMGTAGIYRSITANGAAWARLGFYGITVGTAIWSVTFGLVAATAGAAADWLAAPAADKAAAYGVAHSVGSVSTSTFTMSILVFWLAIVFLGIGMARSYVYPRWLGWLGALLGATTVAAVGIPQFFTGETSTLQTLFAVLAVLTTLWVLIIGIWSARKAW
jgi:hypothetical protein